MVTGRLGHGTHRALKILSRNAVEEDVWAFAEEASQLTEPGDRGNVDAVMQASVAANRALYERIRRCSPFMCEALRDLFKDEIESEIAEREQIAAQKAARKAVQKTQQKTIKNLMETMKWTAEQAMEAMKIPVKDREKYMAGL